MPEELAGTILETAYEKAEKKDLLKEELGVDIETIMQVTGLDRTAVGNCNA